MTVFNTPEPITATLTTAGARVRITASERADTVVLVEPVNGANKADVKVAEKTQVAFADGQLSVKTTKSGDKAGSVAITVELPAGSQLVLNTAWTDVHADGPLGDCVLGIASGQVQLDQAGALRGNAAAGAVAVGHVTGTVTVEGGAAGLRIGEVDGVVKYTGSTGRVWLGRARSDVDFSSAGGAFDLDHADGGVTARSGNCPIRIGRLTGGKADLMNASGGIEVGIAEGTAASVDANSTKGAVRNSLPVRDDAGTMVSVHARTRLDDIVIHRATV